MLLVRRDGLVDVLPTLDWSIVFRWSRNSELPINGTITLALLCLWIL